MRRSGGLLLGATGGMLAVVLAACSGSSSRSVMTVSDATRKSPLTTPSGDAASAGQLVPAPVEGTTTLQAPVRTVRPNANETPSRPIPRSRSPTTSPTAGASISRARA